jgi:hypothetical protein
MQQDRDDPVVFDRSDFVALHDLPSARAADPVIVRAGIVRRRPYLRLLAGFLLLVVIGCVALLGAVQSGLGDPVLAGRVRSMVGNTMGPDFTTAVDSASIRVGRDGRLAIEAANVGFLSAGENSADDVLSTSARSVRLLLDPLPILTGQLKVSSVDVEGVRLDARLFDRGGQFDWEPVRVDALDGVADQVFAALERVVRTLTTSRTRSIVLRDSRIVGIAGNAAGGRGAERDLLIEEVTMALAGSSDVTIEGSVLFDDQRLVISGHTVADAQSRALQELHLSMSGLSRLGADPATVHETGGPGRGAQFGLRSDIAVELRAIRANVAGQPRITASAHLAEGQIMLGGQVSPLHASRLNLAYRSERRTIDIVDSDLNIAATTLPLAGGIIDLSNFDGADGRGFGVELLLNGARAGPTDSSEPSLPFDARTFLRFLKFEQRIAVDDIAIATPLGEMLGSAEIRLSDTSPEISLVAAMDRMETAGIKQLWPHWIARRPREWVLNNLFGGTVSNGSIEVFIPGGLMADAPDGRLDLNADQLRVAFDIDRARVSVGGDLPPLRGTKGRMTLAGERLDVAIDSATAYLPTGRRASIQGGSFVIANTYSQPLMADIDLAIAGQADAVAELIAARPIDALERTGYAPEDFSGEITSRVAARFGLIQTQQPPPPVWSADFLLSSVNVGPQVEGRDIKGLTGTLAVDPDRAVLDASAAVDGVAMDLEVTQPLHDQSPTPATRIVSARLSDAERERLVPGLGAIVEGPIGLRMERQAPGVQNVTLDLAQAKLTVPGIGWTKAAGVAASATLRMADRASGLDITGLTIEGNGFSARGALRIAGSRLENARFERVQLSPADRFALRLDRAGDGYDIAVTGEAIDLRSVLKAVRAGAGGGQGAGSSSGAVPLSVSIDVASALGYNGESLRAVTGSYQGAGGAVSRLDVRGVTGSGEAVVASVTPAAGGTALSLASGDAGAVARFADIYGRVSGGLLNLNLTKAGDGPYAGTLDLRNFSVINEAQLQALVEARAGGDGRSLNEALRGQVNTQSARFERGFGRLTLGEGYLTISDGVVRGPEIGSTFQGIVFDQRGNMEITGTFMPAYGLNSLFAEIPLFGALLGNGRDRGLIGITYKLAGSVAQPQLTVNPMSVIAPGIFRSIFEF